MTDTQYPIRLRYFSLQGLSKTNLINICNQYNYIYELKDSKVKLSHIILKREYPDEFDNFINFSEVDKEELNTRTKELGEMKILQLKTILKNYKLTQNGYKSYLVERIIKYEFYNKIITNEEQKNLMAYKVNENLKYIPEINYINGNYDNDYDIDLLDESYLDICQSGLNFIESENKEVINEQDFKEIKKGFFERFFYLFN